MAKTSSRVSGLAGKLVRMLAAILVCLAGVAFSAHADRESAARDQFTRAVRMRTMLEGLLPRDRSVADYKKTIEAYHKVYLISFRAPEVTPSLIAEAELYREMGHFFDTKYYQASIEMYKVLLRQYPGTRYRGDALFAIAQMQQDNQKDLVAAQATYEEFLKRYPENNRANEARKALVQIAAELGRTPAAAREASHNGNASTAENRGVTRPEPNDSAAADTSRTSATASERVPAGALNAARVMAANLPGLGPILQPHDPQKSWAAVESVQAFNASDHTRIIVRLNDTVTFESAHLPSPNRIYFDLHQARISSSMRAARSIDFKSGLLKSLRMGQNRPNVVRIVLDADAARDYTAALVGKPYRLVIDLRSKRVRAQRPNSQTDLAGPNTPNPQGAAASDEANTAAASAASPRLASETVNVSTTASPAASSTAQLAPGVARRLAGKSGARGTTALVAPPVPRPTSDGEQSLSRELGLKVARIVIDPGHGGHDTGTIGPRGLMEKDVCLDVALRLGGIIKERLPGAQVIYTRKTDTFVPLEERTAIANKAKADLFISIHANSSHDRYARGVETYYLNFATSPEAMEVAARENAYSTESMNDLQTLIQKIARNDKIEESKELATDNQSALSHRLELVSADEHNRGVKRAPFVVLIGANMPSVLVEMSFLSNPIDERLLRIPARRERFALGIYRGVAEYLASIISLSYNKQKFASDDHASSAGVTSAAATSVPGSHD